MKRLTLSLASGIALVLALLAVGLSQGQYVLSPGLYDNVVPLVTTTGSWVITTNSSYYGGSVHNGNSSGGVDSYNFYFYSDEFTLFITRVTTGGSAQVCIDSVCSSLSFFAAVNTFQVPITYSGLSLGTHYVEIITDGAGSVQIDAIFIQSYESPTPTSGEIIITVGIEVTAEITIEQTEEPWVVSFEVTDEAENVQTVAFEYRADAGQLLIAQLLFGILLLLFIIGVFMVWRHINHDD